jgi:hypothetical protein
MLLDICPVGARSSVVVREAQVQTPAGTHYLSKCLLDTGASHGSYIGRQFLNKLQQVDIRPCTHSAKLGDGTTRLVVNSQVSLGVQLYKDDGTLTEVIPTSFFVNEGLGNEAIIGLPEILGEYFEYFVQVLEQSTGHKFRLTILEKAVKDLQRLFLDLEEEHGRGNPRTEKMLQLVRLAREKGSIYQSKKRQIQADNKHLEVQTPDQEGIQSIYLLSQHGMCFADDRLEELVAALGEDEAEPHHHSMTSSAVPEADKPWKLETELRDGEIVEPWTTQPEFCPEESETPDPLSFNEEILHFMEMSVDEAKEEYLGLMIYPSQVEMTCDATNKGKANVCPTKFTRG